MNAADIAADNMAAHIAAHHCDVLSCSQHGCSHRSRSHCCSATIKWALRSSSVAANGSLLTSSSAAGMGGGEPLKPRVEGAHREGWAGLLWVHREGRSDPALPRGHCKELFSGSCTNHSRRRAGRRPRAASGMRSCRSFCPRLRHIFDEVGGRR